MSPGGSPLCESGSAGFVLAGGQSSRMGTDKALVQLDGEPLIVRTLAILGDAGLELAIAGARSDLSTYGQVVEDAGRGPLGGICAGLESTPAEYAVFVSIDTPLLPSSLVSFLLQYAQMAQAGITLVSVTGFTQTFPVVIHRSMLSSLQSELNSGNTGCYAAFRVAADPLQRPLRVLAVEDLVQAGQVEHTYGLPASHWFLNVNTPADLARAETLLPSSIA